MPSKPPKDQASKLIHPLRIGPIHLAGNLILAPLASITDYPFRSICRRFGASLCVSEMISSQAFVRDNRRSIKMASTCKAEHPLSVQLSGSDPAIMARAAAMAQELGAAIVDINMGCPQRKIVKTGSGAALMKDLDLAEAVIAAVVRTVSIPVTVKMRLGWDHSCINAPELARRAQEQGVAMITVHGRTRSQMFSGHADWKAVRRVKEAVEIPVIVNGDICCPDTFRQAMEESGADGAMIGRCALGQPWIFKQITESLSGRPAHPPPLEERFKTMLNHLELLRDFYGEPVGVWMARKHLAWYTKGLKHSARFRDAINRARTLDEARELLDLFFSKIERESLNSL